MLRLLEAIVALLSLFVGCGGKVVVERLEEGSAATSAASGAGGAGGAGSVASSAAASGGGGQSAPPQCLCEDDPGYAPCILPLMCCPCTAQCEDPATFNCSCSEVITCG